MEIQEIRIFLAIIETGGFLSAAKRLGLSQPAVSQSLKNLERKLATPLIERTHPLKPTAIGLELLAHARYVVNSEQSIYNNIDRLKRGYRQTLKIAIDHLAANYYALPLIKKFLSSRPEITLKVHRMAAREIIGAMANNQYDLGIGPFQKDMNELRTRELFTETSLLVTGKKNPDLKIYEKNPLEFLKRSVLLTSHLDDPNARPSKIKIRDYFKDVWEVNDINLQMQLVHEGIGTTFLAKSFLESARSEKSLSLLTNVPFSLIKKSYGIIYNPSAVANQMANDFIENSASLFH